MNQYTLTIFARKYSDLLTELNLSSSDPDRAKSIEDMLDKMFDGMCDRFGKEETEKAISAARDRKKDIPKSS